MADEFDPFAGSTGLPDKLDVVVQEAWFEFDPEYNNGQTLLARFNVDTTDDSFGENGKGIIQYACGNGWEAEDQGQRAVREDGGQKGFNVNTAYQLFIAAAIECDGAEAVLRSEGRGDPRYAPMWVGTAWHLERKEKDYGGEIGKISRLLPTAFLGEANTAADIAGGVGVASGVRAGAAGPAKAAGPVAKAAPAAAVAKAAGVSKAAPAKAAPPVKAAGPVKKAGPVVATQPEVAEPTPDADTSDTFGLDESLYSTLYSLAMECNDHDTFVERAFNEHAEVANDEAVQQVVMDPDPGGLWAKVVADYDASQG